MRCREMAEQYPQMDGRCGTACAYAARVRQFAEQRGVSFDDAMAALISTKELHRAVMLVMADRLKATIDRDADLMYHSCEDYIT